MLSSLETLLHKHPQLTEIPGNLLLLPSDLRSLCPHVEGMFHSDGTMKDSPYRDRVIDVMEELYKFMPFGEKLNLDGKLLDFDKVYQYIIKDAIENILKNWNIRVIRCDKLAEAGWIHKDMFQQILEADVAVVDITTQNPNGFYELGVRHALRDAVTILIRKKGTKISFNLEGLRFIEYDEDMESVAEEKKIAELIQNGLEKKEKDSAVHEVLDLKIGTEPKNVTIQTLQI